MGFCEQSSVIVLDLLLLWRIPDANVLEPYQVVITVTERPKSSYSLMNMLQNRTDVVDIRSFAVE